MFSKFLGRLEVPIAIVFSQTSTALCRISFCHFGAFTKLQGKDVSSDNQVKITIDVRISFTVIFSEKRLMSD